MDDKPAPTWLDLMSLGLASAVMIGVGLGVGVLIDSWLNSSPIATVIGLFVGVVCAIGATVHQVRRFM
ncbi:MAG TPA: AtpZ/AtpI family protein [Acidimicrobiales bacterium]|nr:AtpZ/AtpI family protein [Acidimicrobiales bacterium]